MRPAMLLTGLAGALLLVASPAEAHSGTGLAGGFLAGFLHPLSGPDHLLAMIAVGLWGAILGRPMIFILPVVFPTMMSFGATLGMFDVPFPPVEFGIALSVIMLGAAIGLQFRAPEWLACLMVAVFGLCHGYAHGQELPSAADPAGYSTGFVICTGLLHLVGIGLGLFYDRRNGPVIVRGLGGAIGITGVVFLWQAMS